MLQIFIRHCIEIWLQFQTMGTFVFGLKKYCIKPRCGFVNMILVCVSVSWVCKLSNNIAWADRRMQYYWLFTHERDRYTTTYHIDESTSCFYTVLLTSKNKHSHLLLLQPFFLYCGAWIFVTFQIFMTTK